MLLLLVMPSPDSIRSPTSMKKPHAESLRRGVSFFVSIASRFQKAHDHFRARPAIYLDFDQAQPLGSAASIALTSSSESGDVRGEKRCNNLPSAPIRNFSKFQLIFPAPTGFVSCEVRN